MSEESNSYDEVLKSKLGNFEVSPPSSVWENIESQRSFGHVVANRISINWRTFGTLLLLLLGGGSSVILLGGEDGMEPTSESLLQEKIVPVYKSSAKLEQDHLNAAAKTIELNSPFASAKALSVNTHISSMSNIPDAELIASIEQAGFSKPQQLMDERLNAYVQELDGWESAKPVSFVHIYEMEKLVQLNELKRELNPSAKYDKIKAYDYVRNEFEKRPFKDRASILLSITPMSITKSMTADFNLSSSYLKHRLNSENTRLAYSLEANLHYELKKNKFFETGINFIQIYEEMSFKGEKRFSNQYNFLEIPFLLGFEDRNSKWGYQIKGGLGVQVFNTYQGYIYKIYEEKDNPTVEPVDNSGAQFRMINSQSVKTILSGNHTLSKNQDPNEVLDLEDEKANPFKSTGVVNVHLAAGLTYYHSIKTSFVVTPYYKRSINSITKEEALFSERIGYMGISIGTRIKF